MPEAGFQSHSGTMFWLSLASFFLAVLLNSLLSISSRTICKLRHSLLMFPSSHQAQAHISSLHVEWAQLSYWKLCLFVRCRFIITTARRSKMPLTWEPKRVSWIYIHPPNIIMFLPKIVILILYLFWNRLLCILSYLENNQFSAVVLSKKYSVSLAIYLV